MQCTDLIGLVLETHGESAQVCRVRQPAVEANLVHRGQVKARVVGVAVDVVEFDPVEALSHARRHPLREDRAQARVADVDPALARPALELGAEDRVRVATCVCTPPLPRTGAQVAHRPAAATVQAPHERRGRVGRIDVEHVDSPPNAQLALQLPRERRRDRRIPTAAAAPDRVRCGGIGPGRHRCQQQHSEREETTKHVVHHTRRTLPRSPAILPAPLKTAGDLRVRSVG